jgi:uncharacterized protein YecE (DUF72 family)
MRRPPALDVQAWAHEVTCMAIMVGISGWRYAGWRGDFYPTGLPQRSELEFAARHFDSVEINGSFYSLQRPECYSRWARETPSRFRFAVKGSRYITHMLKLRNVQVPLANFFASGVLCLERKLGPILWQFPAQLPFDSRFEEFIEMLPRDTLRAAELARRHDARLNGRSVTRATSRRRIRHAFEVRHPSFCCPEFIELLRRQRVGLVIADTARRFPYMEDVTASFVYVRLHGAQELYVSGYGRRAIASWAERVRAWSAGSEPIDAVRALDRSAPRRKGRDVYVYFDNDAKVRAPYDAMALRRALGLRELAMSSRDRSAPRQLPAGWRAQRAAEAAARW